MRKIVGVSVILFLVGNVSVWSQSERTGSEILRDVLLTVPPLAKAGSVLSGFAFAVAGGHDESDEYPVPFNIIAYTLVAGIVATNAAVAVSGWSDVLKPTRHWRRAAVIVDAAGVLFSAGILIADLILYPDSSVWPVMSAMLTFGALMIVDMLPFSAELREGVSFGP